MTAEAIWGVIRTVLAATAGAWAVKAGYADGDTVNTVLGAAGVLVVAVWSAIQKASAAKKLAIAEISPPKQP